MENNSIQQQNNFEEEEIDIMAIILRLWEKKWFIIKVTCIFAVLGVYVAVTSPNIYTSSCTFVPQSSKKSSGGTLSSLAALAGISLGDMSVSETLSPIMYPQILDNIDFKKELMYSKIKFNEYEEPIALIDYYTNPEYAKFNLIDIIKKYTIRLPYIILNAIKGEQEVPIVRNVDSMKRYSNEEFRCAKFLNQCVQMTLEEKKGYITITVNMVDPLAAAQLCQITFDLLQKYVTEFKVSKAQNKLNFIQGRYDETRIQYEEKQRDLAQFMDANKVISTAQARAEQDRLMAEYNMATAIYTEMAKQRLQADIQVKEDTPILTAVKPVVVPLERSKPQRLRILFVWTFFGGVLACCLILGCDWLKEHGFKNKWVDKFVN